MAKKIRQVLYLCGEEKNTMETNQVNEPLAIYNTLDSNNVMWLIQQVRNGVNYKKFLQFASFGAFNLTEWASFLHLSERTMLRYKQEEKTFDTLQSEKIIEITLLHNKGTQVFGSATHFNLWLNTVNLALGNIKPKEMLDNSFGINLLKDELTKIEHGVLA
jgi:putative toxin-antitoxin system antitoxin component (TIGR02293 family)